VTALLGKINDNVVSLDICDTSNTPCSVKHKIPLVKRDVLFKVLNRFLYIPGTLGKAGNAYVILKVAVPRMLFPVTFGNIPSGLPIVIVVFQNEF
jgi:hypothetical protein